MALVEMCDKLAIMSASPITITVNGQTFDMLAHVPFSSQVHQIDVPGGTKLAVMYNTQSTHGRTLQVFSVDEVITV